MAKKPIYSLNIANVSRAVGSTSVASVSYITGEKMHDERKNQTFDYQRKERVVASNTLAPDFAPEECKKPDTLFNKIENHLEAPNAKTAKKIRVALPRQFTLEESKIVLENYIRNNLVDKGYCATYAIHTDPKGNNPHAHIIVASRPINEKGEFIDGQTKTAFANDRDSQGKPIYNPDKPSYDPKNREETAQYRIPKLRKDGTQAFRERKGKGKEMLWERVNVQENLLDSQDYLQTLRKNWAGEVNKHLDPAHQIDHRSYKDQGIDRIPTIHEGYAARAIEARGGISSRCETNREIKAQNERAEALKAEMADIEKELQTLRTQQNVETQQFVDSKKTEKRESPQPATSRNEIKSVPLSHGEIAPQTPQNVPQAVLNSPDYRRAVEEVRTTQKRIQSLETEIQTEEKELHQLEKREKYIKTKMAEFKQQGGFIGFIKKQVFDLEPAKAELRSIKQTREKKELHINTLKSMLTSAKKNLQMFSRAVVEYRNGTRKPLERRSPSREQTRTKTRTKTTTRSRGR